MKNECSLITIGIPTYNRAALLVRAIHSARAQTYTNLEIIISDNASSDETEGLCRSLMNSDSRIRYVRQTENIGAAGNFNCVLVQARGEFFMWLGDDDWLDLDYVENCLDVMRHDAALVLVSGYAKYYRRSVYAYDGRFFSVTDRAGCLRLLSYYTTVMDNGVFYGLFRTSAIRNLRISSVLGGDWHFIAEALIVGGFRMLLTTNLHRELGGATESYEVLMRSHGLPSAAAFFPNLYISLSAGKYILKSEGFSNFKFPIVCQVLCIAVIFLRPVFTIPYRVFRYVRMYGK